MSPDLTVLMPVYNAEQFLREAIESVLAQTFDRYEFIIIDDGSTDTSPQIIKGFAERDPRIRVFRQENLGLVATLNRGLQLARAPLVARMDADDICLPIRFETQLRCFQNRSNLGVLGGFINVI